MTVQVHFGAGNSVTKCYENVGQILDDLALRDVLGTSDNVEARINGVRVGREFALSENASVDLVTVANEKAG